MLLITFLVCLSSNFLLIRSTELDDVTITVTPGNPICTTQLPTYTFAEGHNVTISVQWDLLSYEKIFLKSAWWEHEISPNIYKEVEIVQTLSAMNKSFEGIWVFTFTYQHSSAFPEDRRVFRSQCRAIAKVTSNSNEFLDPKLESQNANIGQLNKTVDSQNVNIRQWNKTVDIDSQNTNIGQLNKMVDIDLQNADIGQLNETVDTTVDQNESKYYETILNRLTDLEQYTTTYMEQIHELEKKVDLLERNLEASMTELHDAPVYHREKEIALPNIIIYNGFGQPIFESQQNDKDLLQKINNGIDENQPTPLLN